MASSKFQDTGDPAQRQIYCNSTTSGYIPYSPLKSAAHSQVSKKEYRHKFAGSLYMHQERTTIYDKVFSLTDHPNAAFEPQVHKTTLPMPNALKWSGEIFRRVFTAITSMDIPFSVALVRKIAILIRPWRLVKTPLSNFHYDHTVLSTVQAAENLLRLSAALESSLAQSLYKEAPTPRPPNEQFDCSVSFSSFAIPHDRSHYEDASSCDSKIGPGYWSGDEISM
ncbi:hypothetical protein RSOLAG1IB_06457 [Rhizoctonia solani AG-1 IB]|uniref:Uncharacterized protein n=1 Tax=Thanatephorus cucumeris (strain AG1-IB / isolate 7/3/14) TaxID=1108050 RepID=A0A0B7FBM7_THACB|nr:hypothetical protein RSOLAG1IB_06457 [Rhizoctonia solani AG-1 IB]